MYELLTTISIDSGTYQIRNNGDYRMVLDCFNAINDVELTEEERIVSSLIIFYEDLEEVEDVLGLDEEVFTSLVKQMFNFFNCGREDSVAAKVNFKVIDWDKDSQLISAGINKVANTEIRSVDYCHWWTFMGYFCSIGESALSTVVGIRNKIAKGKKLEKYEQEYKNENPQYFIWDSRLLKQKEDDALLNELWNKE